MASERVQRQLDRLLDEAEEAITKDDWVTLSSRAKAVLAIDPDHKDGQAYLAASERVLGPSGATAAERSASDAAITAPAPGPKPPTDGSDPLGLDYLSFYRRARKHSVVATTPPRNAKCHGPPRLPLNIRS